MVNHGDFLFGTAIFNGKCQVISLGVSGRSVYFFKRIALTLKEMRCPVLFLISRVTQPLLLNSLVIITENVLFLSNCMREIISGNLFT